MPKVRVNDIDMYYEVLGEGFPIVMIMGFLGNANCWDPRLISELSEEFKIITFDNRGAGRTDVPDMEYSIELFADDTVGLMEELGISRAHVFGISLGGMIAQELAINHPKKVEKLILASTFCGGKESTLITPQDLEEMFNTALELGKIDPSNAEVAARMAEKITLVSDYSGKSSSVSVPPQAVKNVVGIASDLVGGDGSWEAETARKLIPNIFTEEFVEENPGAVEVAIQLILTAPTLIEGLIRQVDAIMGHNACDRLELIEAPTLVLAGKRDVYIPPENGEILAKSIPRAELVYFENSAHMLMEETEDVLDAVLSFLMES